MTGSDSRRRSAPGDVLGDRALNRATLERQMLLRRMDLPAVEAIERVVGLNAQEPNVPYIWLWARLSGFRHDHLTAAIEDRGVVRSVLMRATQHLVAAGDFPWLRPLLQPLLARAQRNAFGRRTAGVDLVELVAAARGLLAGRMLTRPELGRLLERRWPGRERQALAWSVQYLEPILHPAPSGTWNWRGETPFVLASDWLGRGSAGAHDDGTKSANRMVRRYLAAFGPAAVADIRAWSGISGLREVVDGMGHELRAFRDTDGRHLVDVAEAPRPDPDVPAPVRFLPEFDNLLLAYGDRTRMMTAETRRRVCVADAVAPTVLVDGVVRGTWAIARAGDAATLTVTPLVRLSPAEGDAVAAEGAELLSFAARDAEARDVRILRPG
jgi:hypothetical protein